MPLPSPVADYLDALARDLAFDPALSRRVRQEVEDHLRESAAAEAAESTIDAENRAISRFGTPQQIVMQYRAVSLHMRMRRTAFLVLCAILAAFAAMESRVVWYGLTHWEIGPLLKSVGGIIVPVDRCAFLLAIALGVVGSIYIISRPIPVAYRPGSRSQIRRGQILIGAAVGATAIAVTCEAILTSWRLAEARWTAGSLFPMASIITEAAIVSAAVVYIRNTVLRASAILSHETPDSGPGTVTKN